MPVRHDDMGAKRVRFKINFIKKSYNFVVLSRGGIKHFDHQLKQGSCCCFNSSNAHFMSFALIGAISSFLAF